MLRIEPAKSLKTIYRNSPRCRGRCFEISRDPTNLYFLIDFIGSSLILILEGFSINSLNWFFLDVIVSIPQSVNEWWKKWLHNEVAPIVDNAKIWMEILFWGRFTNMLLPNIWFEIKVEKCFSFRHFECQWLIFFQLVFFIFSLTLFFFLLGIAPSRSVVRAMTYTNTSKMTAHCVLRRKFFPLFFCFFFVLLLLSTVYSWRSVGQVAGTSVNHRVP